jgi:ribosome maturation protein SDO1
MPSQIYSKEAGKVTVARLKRFGKTFEISVDPDKALEYKAKAGKTVDLREVLLAEGIFSDLKKGLRASQQDLQTAFKTTDIETIAETIVQHGEIQLAAEHRAEEREQKRRKLVYLIQKQAVDGRTGLPLPAARIEAALEQGRIHLDDYKTVEEQFDGIISKLRPILPLKIEQKKLFLTIPAQYAGKSYQIVKSNSSILKENWNTDGSWTATVEIPAGLKVEFMEKLNALTHGSVVVEE